MKKLNTLNKTFWLFVALSASAIMLNSCGDDSEPGGGGGTPSLTTDPGVIINGVKWATRNVDMPGTFATTPESTGKFYQWNRKVAWNATGTVANWDTTIPSGTEWTSANDPSPLGWRVPTFDEIGTLLDVTKVDKAWNNSKKGYTFTDKTTGNSLFLPAAGVRRPGDGTLYNVGLYGTYWCSRQYDSNRAYYLDFSYDGINCIDDYRRAGQSVRCVSKNEN